MPQQLLKRLRHDAGAHRQLLALFGVAALLVVFEMLLFFKIIVPQVLQSLRGVLPTMMTWDGHAAAAPLRPPLAALTAVFDIREREHIASINRTAFINGCIIVGLAGVLCLLVVTASPAVRHGPKGPIALDIAFTVGCLVLFQIVFYSGPPATDAEGLGPFLWKAMGVHNRGRARQQHHGRVRSRWGHSARSPTRVGGGVCPCLRPSCVQQNHSQAIGDPLEPIRCWVGQQPATRELLQAWKEGINRGHTDSARLLSLLERFGGSRWQRPKAAALAAELTDRNAAADRVTDRVLDYLCQPEQQRPPPD